MDTFCNNATCKMCGDCCRFSHHELRLSKKDDLRIRKVLFYRKGILYPHPLNRITIAISKEEKDNMIKEAKKLGINIKIKVLRAKFEKHNIKIQKYFVDEDTCPFLYHNKCLIYEKRPKVCKVFPNKVKIKLSKDSPPNMTFIDAEKEERKLEKSLFLS